MDEEQRERLKAWMTKIMQETGWSAQMWALHAKTTPTNITRFMRNGDFVPSGKTLAKLASAARSTPPLTFSSVVDVHTVPLLTSEQILSLTGGVEMEQITVDGSIEKVATSLSEPRLFAYRITSDTLALDGIMSGDLVIVSPRAAVDGNAVLVAMDGVLVGYRLVGNALHPRVVGNARIVPLGPGIEIVGVIRQVIREIV
jgi:SOS-response transcriptional repressor LexA